MNNRKAVAAIEPSAGALRTHERALQMLGWAGRLVLRGKLGGVDIVGKDHLEGGPRLILMNHSHVLDPLVLAFHSPRPLQFLITEPAMFEALPAKVLASLGQIPKRKLESEARSVRLLKKWTKLGGAVAVFPEGRFPWDGRLLPLQPGLVHLVHYLDVPVVTVRQINGDRLWPPWAEHPRRTRVRLEVDAPIRFQPGDDVERVVSERLRVDPEHCVRYPVRGSKLAAGLARFLMLCPDCGASGTLRDRGNELLCDRCCRKWTVGTDNVLRDGDSEFGISESLAAVFEHLLERWSGAPTMVSAGPVSVLDITGETWREVACGTLHLRENCLRVDSWSLPLADLLAHTLDWGNLILFRTKRNRFAISMPNDSRAVWTYGIEQSVNAYRAP